MNIWEVTFEGASSGVSDDFNLKFVDLKDIIDKYLVLNTKFLEDMKDQISSKENYSAIGSIKNVTDPEGKSVTTNAFFAVMCIDIKDRKFGYLFVITAEGTALAAIWPEGFAEAVKQDSRLLQSVLAFIIKQPDFWKSVDVILPIKEERET
ncbi:MAG: hypothetical protein ACP6IU_11025 [Candidatus Asgardarchaeia archaeon]